MFNGCTGLTSIRIPNNITTIKKGAFAGCSGLESIIVEEGNPTYDSRENCNAIIETATNELIAGCKNSFVPNGVTAIVGRAFYGCSGLTSIEIPNTVTSIEEYIFYNCVNLTTVKLPQNLTIIENSTFENCTALTGINIPTTVTSIGTGAFGKTGLAVIPTV
jgi:hypothetical protein